MQLIIILLLAICLQLIISSSNLAHIFMYNVKRDVETGNKDVCRT